MARDVYFIQCQVTKRIKIGVSKTPAARLKTLQVNSPTKLAIVGILPNIGLEGEARLHEYFNDFVIRGEWFEPAPALLEFIKTHIEVAKDKVWRCGEDDCVVCDLQFKSWWAARTLG